MFSKDSLLFGPFKIFTIRAVADLGGRPPYICRIPFFVYTDSRLCTHMGSCAPPPSKIPDFFPAMCEHLVREIKLDHAQDLIQYEIHGKDLVFLCIFARNGGTSETGKFPTD